MQHRHPFQPFLPLSVRAEDAAADGEYAAMMRFSGLDERSLPRIRMDREPLRQHRPRRVVGGSFWAAGHCSVTRLRRLASHPSSAALSPTCRHCWTRSLARDFPFLGCCYGIGVLGTQIGATMDRTCTEPIRAVPVSLTAAGRADPLLAGLPGSVQAFVRAQGGGPRRCRRDAVVLATSPQCPVQAFRVGRHVYATQFHPELDVAGIRTADRCLQALRVLRTGSR